MIAVVMATGGGCSVDGSPEPAGQQGACLSSMPECIQSCGDPVSTPATCSSQGTWVCDGGVRATECEQGCDSPDMPDCVDNCETFEPVDAVCEDGTWTCGVGEHAEGCDVACNGPVIECVTTCEEMAGFEAPACDDVGDWFCDDGGFELSECSVCGGEEAVECVPVCGEGELYIADCIDGDWSCGDGVLLESCGSACDGCGQGCEGDPWACVPSCDAFEVYDAACDGMQWSCGDGVLAADC